MCDDEEQFFVFEDFQYSLSDSLYDFFKRGIFANVTLVCDEEDIRAHQVVLSAASPYFEKILFSYSYCQTGAEPIIVFTEVSKAEMLLLLEYMYKGYVSVPKSQVSSLRRTAEKLQIKGFSKEDADISRALLGRDSMTPDLTLSLLQKRHGAEARNNVEYDKTIKDVSEGSTNLRDSNEGGESVEAIGSYIKNAGSCSTKYLSTIDSATETSNDQMDQSPKTSRNRKLNITLNDIEFTSDESQMSSCSQTKAEPIGIVEVFESDEEVLPKLVPNPVALRKTGEHTSNISITDGKNTDYLGSSITVNSTSPTVNILQDIDLSNPTKRRKTCQGESSTSENAIYQDIFSNQSSTCGQYANESALFNYFNVFQNEPMDDLAASTNRDEQTTSQTEPVNETNDQDVNEDTHRKTNEQSTGQSKRPQSRWLSTTQDSANMKERTKTRKKPENKSGKGTSNLSERVTCTKDGESLEDFANMTVEQLKNFCLVCDKKKKNIVAHIKEHRLGVTGRTRHVCQVCFKKFNIKRFLELHKCQPLGNKQ